MRGSVAASSADDEATDGNWANAEVEEEWEAMPVIDTPGVFYCTPPPTEVGTWLIILLVGDHKLIDLYRGLICIHARTYKFGERNKIL